MTDIKSEIQDEELKKVSGGFGKKVGPKTGDQNEAGDVYFEFPLFLSSFSGYYSRTQLEALVNDNIDLAEIVKQFITDDIKSAVKKLYPNNDIPDNVKLMMGIL